MSSRLPTRKSARIAIKQSLEDVSVPDSATNKTKRSAIKRAKKNKTKHVYQNEEDKRWEEQYSLLRKYHAKHGNTEVPGNYKVGNKKLGSWVYRQRTLYRLKRLQPERKQRLDSIDFRLTDKTTKAGSVRAKAATKTSAKPGTVSNLSRLPVSIKGAFGKIGFAKFGKKGITPVYFLSPFDLRQDSYPRNQWLETYQKLNKESRLRDMPHLVYWYGEKSESRRYGFVSRASAVVYDKAEGQFGAVKEQYESLREKVSAKSALTTRERRLVPAMTEMYNDLETNARNKLSHVSSDSEESSSESASEEESSDVSESEAESESESESTEFESESESELSESCEEETLPDDSDAGEDDISDMEELEEAEKKAHTALAKARKMKKKASIAKIQAETYLMKRQADHLKAEAKQFMEEASNM